MNIRRLRIASIAYASGCLLIAMAVINAQTVAVLWDLARSWTVIASRAALWASPVVLVGGAVAWFLTSPWDEDTDAHWDDEL